MQPDDQRILGIIANQGFRLVCGILEGDFVRRFSHGILIAAGEHTAVGKERSVRADAAVDAVAVETVGLLSLSGRRKAGDYGISIHPMILEGDHEVIVEG